MKLINKIPVPHTWTENYPHYIASPKLLRLCYLFVVISALFTFIGSLIYYFSFQRDIVSVIGYELNKGDEWECVGIGSFSGEYSMLSRHHVPSWNLSQSTSTGFADIYDEKMYYTTLPYKSTKDNYYFNAFKPFVFDDIVYDPYSISFGDQLLSWEERTNYDVELANAKTVESCVKSFTNYACSDVYRNQSPIWNLYEFKVQNLTGGTMGNINLYAYNTTTKSYELALLNYFLTNYNKDVAYIYTSDWEEHDFNLCDVITWGIANKSLSWDPSGIPVDVSCKFDDNYCGVNVTNAFTLDGNFSGYSNGIPSAMTMIHTNPRTDEQWVDYSTIMMLGSQLGDTCHERWSKTCQEYFNIAGLCKKMYVAPFECRKEQRKELWTIISLAFSSSSLILTILLVASAFLIKKCCHPVYEKPVSHANVYNNTDLDDHLL